MSGHVLIAGAGIGGLTLATALAQGGATVEILERTAILSEVGAGLQQSANAMQVHAALGTANAVIARGFEPHRAKMRAYDTGRVLLDVPLKDSHTARYGQPYIHIHRADLHAVLVEAAREAGVKINLDCAVTGYTQDSDAVRVQTTQGELAGDTLIGADGIQSAVRQAFPTLLHNHSEARFTGQIAWRGTVATSALPAGLIPPDATVWLGPGRHVVAYYLRGGEMVNFVAVEERDAWTEESWHLKGDKADLRRAFDGWDPVVTTLLSACETPFLWGLFDRPPLSTWRDGRVGLLGDACHPMLPFMAQGAAMAIEDGYVLAQEILASGDVSHALMRYEALRKPRTSKLQDISRTNAESFHISQTLPRLIRNASYRIATALPVLSHLKLRGIYGHDVTQD